MAESIAGRVSQANGRLKAGNIAVQIEIRSNKLCLRATLPPRPGSNKTLPYQQRIPLGIGVHVRGVQLAEKEARKVGALVDCGEFDWVPYMRELPETIATPPASPTIATIISQFEIAYFQRRQRTAKSETTWNDDYWAVYKQLQQDEPISEQTLLNAILVTKPDSKQRKRYCMALKALAEHAGIDLNTKPYAGNYSPKKVTPRDIPNDEVIAAWRNKVPNEAWRWVYGMIATFGLRPHETFHIVDFKDEIIEIGEDTKTGSRKVWACYPEWVEEWNLHEVYIPKINYRNNKEIGMKFNRYLNDNVHLPFQPYDIRHAWAIRTLEFGLPDSLAAQQMGHSVQIHNDLYHAWITDRHHQRAYDLIMQRPDRPKPPNLNQ